MFCQHVNLKEPATPHAKISAQCPQTRTHLGSKLLLRLVSAHAIDVQPYCCECGITARNRVNEMKKLIMAALALSLIAAPCLFSVEANAASATASAKQHTATAKAGKKSAQVKQSGKVKTKSQGKAKTKKVAAKAKQPTAKKKTNTL